MKRLKYFCVLLTASFLVSCVFCKSFEWTRNSIAEIVPSLIMNEDREVTFNQGQNSTTFMGDPSFLSINSDVFEVKRKHIIGRTSQKYEQKRDDSIIIISNVFSATDATKEGSRPRSHISSLATSHKPTSIPTHRNPGTNRPVDNRVRKQMSKVPSAAPTSISDPGHHKDDYRGGKPPPHWADPSFQQSLGTIPSLFAHRVYIIFVQQHSNTDALSQHQEALLFIMVGLITFLVALTVVIHLDIFHRNVINYVVKPNILRQVDQHNVSIQECLLQELFLTLGLNTVPKMVYGGYRTITSSSIQPSNLNNQEVLYTDARSNCDDEEALSVATTPMELEDDATSVQSDSCLKLDSSACEDGDRRRVRCYSWEEGEEKRVQRQLSGLSVAVESGVGTHRPALTQLLQRQACPPVGAPLHHQIHAGDWEWRSYQNRCQTLLAGFWGLANGYASGATRDGLSQNMPHPVHQHPNMVEMSCEKESAPPAFWKRFLKWNKWIAIVYPRRSKSGGSPDVHLAASGTAQFVHLAHALLAMLVVDTLCWEWVDVYGTAVCGRFSAVTTNSSSAEMCTSVLGYVSGERLCTWNQSLLSCAPSPLSTSISPSLPILLTVNLLALLPIWLFRCLMASVCCKRPRFDERGLFQLWSLWLGSDVYKYNEYPSNRGCHSDSGRFPSQGQSDNRFNWGGGADMYNYWSVEQEARYIIDENCYSSNSSSSTPTNPDQDRSAEHETPSKRWSRSLIWKLNLKLKHLLPPSPFWKFYDMVSWVCSVSFHWCRMCASRYLFWFQPIAFESQTPVEYQAMYRTIAFLRHRERRLYQQLSCCGASGEERDALLVRAFVGEIFPVGQGMGEDIWEKAVAWVTYVHSLFPEHSLHREHCIAFNYDHYDDNVDGCVTNNCQGDPRAIPGFQKQPDNISHQFHNPRSPDCMSTPYHHNHDEGFCGWRHSSRLSDGEGSMTQWVRREKQRKGARHRRWDGYGPHYIGGGRWLLGWLLVILVFVSYFLWFIMWTLSIRSCTSSWKLEVWALHVWLIILQDGLLNQLVLFSMINLLSSPSKKHSLLFIYNLLKTCTLSAPRKYSQTFRFLNSQLAENFNSGRSRDSSQYGRCGDVKGVEKRVRSSGLQFVRHSSVACRVAYSCDYQFSTASPILKQITDEDVLAIQTHLKLQHQTRSFHSLFILFSFSVAYFLLWCWAWGVQISPILRAVWRGLETGSMCLFRIHPVLLAAVCLTLFIATLGLVLYAVISRRRLIRKIKFSPQIYEYKTFVAKKRKLRHRFNSISAATWSTSAPARCVRSLVLLIVRWIAARLRSLSLIASDTTALVLCLSQSHLRSHLVPLSLSRKEDLESVGRLHWCFCCNPSEVTIERDCTWRNMNLLGAPGIKPLLSASVGTHSKSHSYWQPYLLSRAQLRPIADTDIVAALSSRRRTATTTARSSEDAMEDFKENYLQLQHPQSMRVREFLSRRKSLQLELRAEIMSTTTTPGISVFSVCSRIFNILDAKEQGFLQHEDLERFMHLFWVPYLLLKASEDSPTLFSPVATGISQRLSIHTPRRLSYSRRDSMGSSPHLPSPVTLYSTRRCTCERCLRRSPGASTEVFLRQVLRVWTEEELEERLQKLKLELDPQRLHTSCSDHGDLFLLSSCAEQPGEEGVEYRTFMIWLRGFVVDNPSLHDWTSICDSLRS